MILNSLDLPSAKRTVIWYSVSGHGKTGQVGEVAKWLYEETGKKSLLHNMDSGGWETVKHLVDADILDVIPHIGRPKPWEWSSFISRGFMPSPSGEAWVKVDPEIYAGVFFDGATGLSNILMEDLRSKSGAGKNPVGQAPAIKFKEGERTITNNSPAHFGLVQSDVVQDMQDSLRIPVDLVAWTALAKQADEEATSSSVIGPQLAGRAATANIPQIFQYTFHLSMEVGSAALGTETRSRLYMRPHADGGAKALANPRNAVGTSLPEFIEPASIVEAFKLIDSKKAEATAAVEALKERVRAKFNT